MTESLLEAVSAPSSPIVVDDPRFIFETREWIRIKGRGFSAMIARRSYEEDPQIYLKNRIILINNEKFYCLGVERPMIMWNDGPHEMGIGLLVKEYKDYVRMQYMNVMTQYAISCGKVMGQPG